MKVQSKKLTGILASKGQEIGLIVIDGEFIIYAELRTENTCFRGKEAVRKILESDYYLVEFDIEQEAIEPNTLLLIPEILEDDYVIFE